MARNYKRDKAGKFAKVAGSPAKKGNNRARNAKIKSYLKTGAKIAIVAGAAYATHQSSQGRVRTTPRHTALKRTPSATPLYTRPRTTPTRAPNGAIPMPAARVPNAGTAGKKMGGGLSTLDDMAAASSAAARHSARYNSPNPKVALEYASSAQYLRDIELMAKHWL